MNYDSTRDFLLELDDIPSLPADEHGEWHHAVSSGWVDGVFYREVQDPNAVVIVERFANNDTGYENTLIDYEVRLLLTDDELSMSPETAIALGRHLIAAGTAAMRDLSQHAWFLTGGGQ